MSFGQPPTGGGQVDPELQHFLEVASQKARFTANVHQFMDACWDKCIDKVPSSMDSRTQRCFTGCVDRFMDVSNMVVNQLGIFFVQLSNSKLMLKMILLTVVCVC